MNRDLFGNERPEQSGPRSTPVALSMFDHAAERAALESGRSKSQELAEIVAPDA